MPRHVVTLTLTEDLLAFNRAVGIVRRRNLPIESLSVGPAELRGYQRLTLLLTAEDEAVDRMIRQLRKMVGVLEATGCRSSSAITRELALIRVRAPRARYAQLLDALALFNAIVLDESAGEIVAEVTGSEPFIRSLVRSLEAFGIVEIVRSGAVAMTTAGVFAVLHDRSPQESILPVRPADPVPANAREPATSIPHAQEMRR
ncbi:MAG: acetolactate synthase small subunit [Gemmatimonadota bacterium]